MGCEKHPDAGFTRRAILTGEGDDSGKTVDECDGCHKERLEFFKSFPIADDPFKFGFEPSK